MAVRTACLLALLGVLNIGCVQSLGADAPRHERNRFFVRQERSCDAHRTRTA